MTPDEAVRIVRQQIAEAKAEVGRLRALMAAHQEWIDADPDQWVMRKDSVIDLDEVEPEEAK